MQYQWNEIKDLSNNAFGKEMISTIKKIGYSGTYAELAEIIYRSESTVMTWCAPNSENPLPLWARHHIFLAVNEVVFQKNKNPRAWSADDDHYLLDNYKTQTYAEIAKVLCRSYPAVASRVVELGLRSQPIYTDEQVAVFFDISKTNAEVAAIAGVSHTVAAYQRKVRGIVGFPGQRGRKRKSKKDQI